MSLSALNLLEACQSRFDRIWIAHSTLRWLFEENTRIRFHQPSRVAAAHALMHALNNGTMQVLRPTGAASENLVRQVGQTLADLLSTAEAHRGSDIPHVVVVGGKVYTVGSRMKEEAELGAMADHIRTTSDVVDALIKRNVLSQVEAAVARRRHARDSEDEAAIVESCSVLMLDDTAASLLFSSSLFAAITQAGFMIVVPTSVIDEARQLIAYDVRSKEVLTIIDRLRVWLRTGLAEGWISIGAAGRRPQGEGEGEGENSRLFEHPSVGTLDLVRQADLCVFNDRFMNGHMNMAGPDGSVPLVSLWQLIDYLEASGKIDNVTLQEARTQLRRDGHALAPVNGDELLTLLRGCAVVDGGLVETVELRALRESVQRLRMSDILQWPQEQGWLERLGLACLHSLQTIQPEFGSDPEAEARANWLIGLSDPRGWMHRIDTDEANKTALTEWATQLVMLSAVPSEDDSEGYRAWLDARVLAYMEVEEKAQFDAIVERVCERIEALIDGAFQESSDEEIDQSILHGYLRDRVLAKLPERVADALIQHDALASRLGIERVTIVRMGDNGPSVSRTVLYEAARRALKQVGDDDGVAIKDSGGRQWSVCAYRTVDAVDIVLADGNEAIRLQWYDILAADRKVRMVGLERLAREAMLSHEWLEKQTFAFADHPPDDDEFAVLIKDAAQAPASVFTRLRTEIASGGMTIGVLVSKDPCYFKRLVGEVEVDMSARAYLEECVLPLAEALVLEAGARGLRRALQLATHRDVSRILPLDAVPQHDLVKLYEAVAAHGDPISRIACVEAALPRLETITELEAPLGRIIEALLAVPCADDQYDMLGALYALTFGDLAQHSVLQAEPPYYRRQAALAQASGLQAEFGYMLKDTANLIQWLTNRGEGSAAFVQGMIDLRLEPRWLPEYALPQQLRAEVVGRLLMASKENEERICQSGLMPLLLGPEALLTHARIQTLQNLPGPMEVDDDLYQETPAEVLESLRDAFSGEALETHKMIQAQFIASVSRDPSAIASLATEALKRLDYIVETVEEELFPLLAALARIAAISRSSELAAAIRTVARLKRRREAFPEYPESEMQVALVAAAALPSLDEWSIFISDWMTEIAFAVRGTERARAVLNFSQLLASLEPSLRPYLCRADACFVSAT